MDDVIRALSDQAKSSFCYKKTGGRCRGKQGAHVHPIVGVFAARPYIRHPLADPDALQRPTGSTAGFALRSGRQRGGRVGVLAARSGMM